MVELTYKGRNIEVDSNVTELHWDCLCQKLGIVDLGEMQGLGKLKNLTELTFNFCHVREIGGLASLKNLKKLHLGLGHNDFTEVKGLDDLHNLESLDLSDNQITEIKGLDALKNLKRLNLGRNKITEVKGLDALHNLESLILDSNPITEIKGLAALQNLKNLELGCRGITEIRGLDALQNLKKLDLECSEITEIKGLDALCNLESLNLSQNAITEIKGLATLRNLKNLELWGNKITEIKGLDALQNLKTLNLDQNEITEIKGLTALRNLERLNLGNNYITEVKGLDALHNLKSLLLSNNTINEIHGLDDLQNLEVLDLRFNEIAEIQGLEFLTQLKRLYLQNNKIEEVKGLDWLLNLEVLGIGNISNFNDQIQDPPPEALEFLLRPGVLASIRNHIKPEDLNSLGGLIDNGYAAAPTLFVEKCKNDPTPRGRLETKVPRWINTINQLLDKRGGEKYDQTWAPQLDKPLLPDFIEAWVRLGEYYAILGKPGEALYCYEQLMDRKNDLADNSPVFALRATLPFEKAELMRERGIQKARPLVNQGITPIPPAFAPSEQRLKEIPDFDNLLKRFVTKLFEEKKKGFSAVTSEKVDNFVQTFLKEKIQLLRQALGALGYEVTDCEMPYLFKLVFEETTAFRQDLKDSLRTEEKKQLIREAFGDFPSDKPRLETLQEHAGRPNENHDDAIQRIQTEIQQEKAAVNEQRGNEFEVPKARAQAHIAGELGRGEYGAAKDLIISKYPELTDIFYPQILREQEQDFLRKEEAKVNQFASEMKSQPTVLKIILAGEAGVGKTTLLHTLIEKVFAADTGMTLGLDLWSFKLQVAGKEIFLQCYDFQGADGARKYLPPFVPGAKGALLLFDITRMSTLDSLEEWAGICRAEDRNLPILLCGMKTDLEAERSVPSDYPREFFEPLKLTDYVETSAKSYSGVYRVMELLVHHIFKRSTAPR